MTCPMRQLGQPTYPCGWRRLVDIVLPSCTVSPPGTFGGPTPTPAIKPHTLVEGRCDVSAYSVLPASLPAYKVAVIAFATVINPYT